MHLPAILGIAQASDIDPSRPIVILGRELGPEAATEAYRLVEAGGAGQVTSLWPKTDFPEPFYWSVSRAGSMVGEIFGFPAEARIRATVPAVGDLATIESVDRRNAMGALHRALSLPTSVELALVRALDGAAEDCRDRIMSGDHLVAIGDPVSLDKIFQLARRFRPPLVHSSTLWQKYTNLELTIADDIELTKTTVECLAGSFVAAPLKFRFLEIYRIIENRFLRAVLEKINREFFSGPGAVLEAGAKSVKAEVNQFVELALLEPVFFEIIYQCFSGLRSLNNQLAHSLFRKLNKGSFSSPAASAGAALVYYLRCAIVHAGEKDIIFEHFPDGDDLLQAVIEPVEEAALALAGLHLSR